MDALAYLAFFDPSVDPDNPGTVVETAVALAQERISADVWGRLYGQGLARLAAHLLELRRREASALESGASGVGPATSIRTGDLSISWAGPTTSGSLNDDSNWYNLTNHGREFLSLRAQLVRTPFTA